MQQPSFDSVKVFSLDLEPTLAALQRAAHEVLLQHPEVLRVVLFGSLVRGDSGPGSDADMALILRADPEPVWFRRIPRYLPCFADVAVPVDLLPYTEGEIHQGLATGNTYFHEIHSGRILADRSDQTCIVKP